MTGFTFHMQDLLVSNNKYLGCYSLSGITKLWTSAYRNYCKQFGGIIVWEGTWETSSPVSTPPPTLEATFQNDNSKPNLGFTLTKTCLQKKRVGHRPVSISVY